MSRRNNFRVIGIPVTTGEDCEKIIKDKVFALFEGSPEISVERCHRDGRGGNDRPPHILVRCLSYKDKVMIMKQRRRVLENQSYFRVDDLTKQDLMEKKKGAQKASELFQQGTKLHFSGGKWRDTSGKPYQF